MKIDWRKVWRAATEANHGWMMQSAERRAIRKEIQSQLGKKPKRKHVRSP